VFRNVRICLRVLAATGSVIAAAACVATSATLAAGDANTESCSGFPATESSAGFRSYLPDCRAYETVTRFVQAERAVGLNGVEPGSGVPSVNGGAVDWEALGACCGATSGAANLYQSERLAGGWQTRTLTPTPSKPLAGLTEEQAPVFWSGDLAQTIFATPASYAVGDARPEGSGKDDLYLRGPAGSLTWLSRGPLGDGSEPDTATFDGATPDAGEVAFSTVEGLTANATGLNEALNTPAEFLYVREVANETTTLVDVDSADELLDSYGASLGDGGFFGESIVPVDEAGTTTNAVSQASSTEGAAGSKIFFESPPAGASDLPEGMGTHLYMRNLHSNTTVALDDPALTSEPSKPTFSARYEGASADGSLVFFTSDEGLDGASPADELYEFNTTTEQIGQAAPMSAIPISSGNSGVEQPSTTLTSEASAGEFTITLASTDGFYAGRPIVIEGETLIVASVLNATEIVLQERLVDTHPLGASVSEDTDGVIGVSAISNDGSHVYFVANTVLATNLGPGGRSAEANQPNLYVYDTITGRTTFIATLAWTDVSNCKPTCGQGDAGVLVAEPDIDRPAVPTPTGSVLVFESSDALTDEDVGPATTLAAPTLAAEHTLTVASTTGFLAGHTIAIDSGAAEELAVIEAVEGPTTLKLSEYGPAGIDGLDDEHAVGSSVVQLHFEVYRYEASGSSLICLSCTPAGVSATGSATLGDTGGGSYAPPDEGAPMSEDGTRIFFDSPDQLVPEAPSAGEYPDGQFGASIEPTNVYEWEDGDVYLISDPNSTTNSALDGTTPSGNDVFFTTADPLLSEGYANIYDARVGGGFPASSESPPPCKSSKECRGAAGSTAFITVPASATLIGSGNIGANNATFAIAKITTAQRTRFARTGRLELSVTASAAGELAASATAKLHGRTQRVAHASVTLATAGNATLTLTLDRAARSMLANHKPVTLRIVVGFSASGAVEVAQLELNAKRARKHG
jgi:hypothetical protein